MEVLTPLELRPVDDVGTGPPPQPSPLSGCYLLIVIGEPHSDDHKEIILQKIAKGFLSWDSNTSQVDLEKELQALTAQAPEGEEARNGERLIQYATENLVTEVLIHPQVNTLVQCVRNLLSSFTRHRHLIHAGYTFAGNGSWILQDGTFSLSDFTDAFQEAEVQRVLRAYENSVTVDVHCSPDGDWSTERLSKEPFSRLCKVRVNPDDHLTAGGEPIGSFISYISPFLKPASIETLLEPSDVVGNIRFSHPTLYVFPGGQGDAALFGINGFNMLVDGGFGRKSCFWDFARHLDRLDAVLMTRLNNGNVSGVASVMRRKKLNHVYPQIGHFFCNIQERRNAASPDGDKDRDPLLVNLADEGQEIVLNLRHLQLRPHSCYREGNNVEPVNLYHKVGHGKLDMYIISPTRDSREVKDFIARWNANDARLFSGPKKDSKEFLFPLQNLVSICALLVWQPANPSDTITRILFPGSTPQQKIFEGLEKLKHLEFLKHPVCSMKSITPSGSTVGISSKVGMKLKSTATVLDKLLPGEKEVSKEASQKAASFESNKQVKSATIPVVPDVKTTKTVPVTAAPVPKVMPLIKQKVDKPSTRPEPLKKTEANKSLDGEKKTEKPKVAEKKVETKVKVESKVAAAKPKPDVKPRSVERKIQKTTVTTVEKKSEKSSPTTPKKTVESKVNGVTSKLEVSKTNRSASRGRPSPTGTPAKSAKDANNRKVVESKINVSRVSTSSRPPAKPLKKDEPAKPAERKPIARKAKPSISPVKRGPASPSKTAAKTAFKTEKESVIRKIKSDVNKVGTDSSTVSTPSTADPDVTLLKAKEALDDSPEALSGEAEIVQEHVIDVLAEGKGVEKEEKEEQGNEEDEGVVIEAEASQDALNTDEEAAKDDEVVEAESKAVEEGEDDGDKQESHKDETHLEENIGANEEAVDESGEADEAAEEEEEYLIIEREDVDDSLQEPESAQDVDEGGEDVEEDGELKKQRDEVESEKEKKKKDDVKEEEIEAVDDGIEDDIDPEAVNAIETKEIDSAEVLEDELQQKQDDTGDKLDAVEAHEVLDEKKVDAGDVEYIALSVTKDGLISPENKEKIEEEVQEIITSAQEIISKKQVENEVKTEEEEREEGSEKKKSEEGEETKELSSISPEEKLDNSSEKNREGTDENRETTEDNRETTEDDRDTDQRILDQEHDEYEIKRAANRDIADQKYAAEESQPDEKFSTTVESAATTAPTLPEDERIPLEEIVEEKHTKEDTKEKEVPAVVVMPRTEQPTTLPQVPVAAFPAHGLIHHRDIVKTPDEVADLPMHEEVDPGMYESDEFARDFNKIKDDSGSSKKQDSDDLRRQSPELEITGELQLKDEDKHSQPEEKEREEAEQVKHTDEREFQTKDSNIDTEAQAKQSEREIDQEEQEKGSHDDAEVFGKEGAEQQEKEENKVTEDSNIVDSHEEINVKEPETDERSKLAAVKDDADSRDKDEVKDAEEIEVINESENVKKDDIKQITSSFIESEMAGLTAEVADKNKEIEATANLLEEEQKPGDVDEFKSDIKDGLEICGEVIQPVKSEKGEPIEDLVKAAVSHAVHAILDDLHADDEKPVEEEDVVKKVVSHVDHAVQDKEAVEEEDVVKKVVSHVDHAVQDKEAVEEEDVVKEVVSNVDHAVKEAVEEDDVVKNIVSDVDHAVQDEKAVEEEDVVKEVVSHVDHAVKDGKDVEVEIEDVAKKVVGHVEEGVQEEKEVEGITEDVVEEVVSLVDHEVEEGGIEDIVKEVVSHVDHTHDEQADNDKNEEKDVQVSGDDVEETVHKETVEISHSEPAVENVASELSASYLDIIEQIQQGSNKTDEHEHEDVSHERPKSASPIPPSASPIPPSASPIPAQSASPIPPSESPVPQAASPIPPSASPIPAQSASPIPPSESPVPQAASPIPPSASPIPAQSASPIPPSESPIPPSASPIPAQSASPIPPSESPIPQAESPIPYAASPIPPSESPIPQAASPIPPSASPIPPSESPIPQAASPIPPSASPIPAQSASPIPPSESPIPQAASPIPYAASPIPPSESPIPQAASPIPPSASPIPPSESPIPQAASPIPPSASPIPAQSASPIPPSESPIPQAASPIPYAASPIPPSESPIPQAASPIPPSASPIPPSESPIPQVASPIPPSASPIPPSESPIPPSTSPIPPSESPIQSASPVPQSASPLPQSFSPVPQSASPIPQSASPEPTIAAQDSAHLSSTTVEEEIVVGGDRDKMVESEEASKEGDDDEKHDDDKESTVQAEAVYSELEVPEHPEVVTVTPDSAPSSPRNQPAVTAKQSEEVGTHADDVATAVGSVVTALSDVAQDIIGKSEQVVESLKKDVAEEIDEDVDYFEASPKKVKEIVRNEASLLDDLVEVSRSAMESIVDKISTQTESIMKTVSSDEDEDEEIAHQSFEGLQIHENLSGILSHSLDEKSLEEVKSYIGSVETHLDDAKMKLDDVKSQHDDVKSAILKQSSDLSRVESSGAIAFQIGQGFSDDEDKPPSSPESEREQFKPGTSPKLVEFLVGNEKIVISDAEKQKAVDDLAAAAEVSITSTIATDDLEASVNKEQEEAGDVTTVKRMLVTASSEDGGAETEVCPSGSITFPTSLSSKPSSEDLTSMLPDKEPLDDIYYEDNVDKRAEKKVADEGEKVVSKEIKQIETSSSVISHEGEGLDGDKTKLESRILTETVSESLKTVETTSSESNDKTSGGRDDEKQSTVTDVASEKNDDVDDDVIVGKELVHELLIESRAGKETVEVIEDFGAGAGMSGVLVGLKKEDSFRSGTPGSEDIDMCGPLSPMSDISSGQASRVPDGDDAPGTPRSVTSPSPAHFLYEARMSPPIDIVHTSSGLQYDPEHVMQIGEKLRDTKIDTVMTSSFYGQLPPDPLHHLLEEREEQEAADPMTTSFYEAVSDDALHYGAAFTGRFDADDGDEEFDFEKAVHEHRTARGKDLTSSPGKSYQFEASFGTNGTASHQNGNGNGHVDEHHFDDDVHMKKDKVNGKTVSASTALHTSVVEVVGSPSKKSSSSAEHDPLHHTEGGSSSSPQPESKPDPIQSWGKPLGLPSPAPPPTNGTDVVNATNKGTPKKEKKPLLIKKSATDNKTGLKKRPESPVKSADKRGMSNKDRGGKATGNPIFTDLAYVPHHGNSYYSNVEFFKKVRARYYVFSGTEPSREVYNALLEGKQAWDDKELEVTIIPTYDTDTLGYWVAENEDILAKHKIDLSPSASRCTINLQDHETSCSAYRLEF